VIRLLFPVLALAAALGIIQATGTPALPPPPPAAVDSSPVIRAMEHELRRSADSLHLKGSPRPYFISYLLWDVASYHMQASLGSCEFSDMDEQHLADVDLHLGDYRQDNTNFQGGIVFGPRLRMPLPQANDTTILRLSLWAATDAKYKVALEQLAQKRAFLANHSGSDSLPDFTKQRVLKQVHLEPQSLPDTAKVAALGRDLSRYLAGFPWLEESRVGYQYYYTTFYYVDSEGSRFIQTVKEHTLLVALFTQAKDGAPLWDYLRVSTLAPLAVGDDKGPAGFAALKDSLQPILRRLETLRKAEPLANYRGPVLLTGSAAGELLNKSLLFPQTRLREPLGASQEPNFLVSLAGRKLFPSGVTVTDSPSMEAWEGRPLFGHYEFDHQGQPAKDITLIEDGRVRDYLLGKVPVLRANGHSGNGHWRYGGGFPGVVLLKSSKPMAEAEMKTRLSAMGEDEGNGFGLMVSKTLDEDAFKLLRHPLAAQLLLGDAGDGRGTFSLSAPCEVDRVDSRSGQVTPVRGLSFPSLDTKSLRDIAAVGDGPHLYEPQAAYTVLCPSLLFTLLDLKGSRSAQPRLPYLK
jgi:TldD protein